jgi:hypothetical protein
MKFLLSFLFSILVFCSLGQLKSPDEFLGYPLGSRFTYHYQLVNYCKYVAAQKPMQAEWISYGQTNENRELGILILTKPELKGKLSEIKDLHQQVIQGKKSPTADLPVIINLSFNVHGNEAAGSEAALGAIYDLVKDGGLLTSSTKDFVVLMDPCINPDGRDAYVTQYNRRNFTQGGNADPNDQEHFEGNVSGRHNHFSFDLNRDWVWQTQIETQQRIAFFQSWLPMVHADFHEQSYQNSYYFPPAAKPYLNFISSTTKELQISVGKSFAQLFDQQKWPYFTSEVYDLFYPGYGDTYPVLNGALGMTLEQGGIRGGLQAQKSNSDTIKFTDRVNHHRQLAVNLVGWSLTNSEAVKSSFYQNQSNSRLNPSNVYKSYLIPKAEISKSSELIRLLKRNRIIIGQVDKDFQSIAFSYQEQKNVPIKASSGDLLISAYQSASPMIQTLLDPTPVLEDSLTYDITAWNLFQIHGIRAYGLKEKVSSSAFSELRFVDNQVQENHVAYVFKPSSLSSSFVNTVRKAGYLVVFNDKKVGFEGQSFEPGHLWVLKKRGSWERLNQLANIAQVKLVGINSYRSQEGADLGSEHFLHVQTNRIAVVVDGSFDVGQQGELAYYLTKQMQLNPSFIPFSQLFKANLLAYSHLIFPNSKSAELSKSQQILLDDYVRKGGQAILFENAGNLLTGKDLMLKEKDLTDSSAVQVAYEDSERHEISKTLTGNLLEVQVEKSHPLGFRVNQANMLIINQADQLINPNVKWKAILQTSDKPVTYGFMGNLVKPKVANSLMLGMYSLGKGNYIWFGFNPLFRAIPNQSMVLFENSILYHGN